MTLLLPHPGAKNKSEQENPALAQREAEDKLEAGLAAAPACQLNPWVMPAPEHLGTCMEEVH